MFDNPSITHVIYDLDGLLLDTESLIDRVNAIITGQYGKTVDSSIKSKIAGRNALESAQILIDDLELPLTPHDYLQHKDALIDDIYPQAQPLPGVISLIKHLHHHKIPQAVATSSSQRPFSLKTTFHQTWFDLFDCIVTGDDPAIGAGKPAPDIFLIAAARMGASPATCLVFEDSLAGVAAARSAGMSVVAVPDASMNWHRYQDAHQILRSLTEFKPEHWHLPAK